LLLSPAQLFMTIRLV